MSKHKLEDAEYAEFIKWKIRKLRKERKRVMKKCHVQDDASDPEDGMEESHTNDSFLGLEYEDETLHEEIPNNQIEEVPPHDLAVEKVILVENTEILNLLGEDPTPAQTYGKEIHLDVAKRFEHIVKTGLSKDEKKLLTDKYLPPSNCTLIDAPAMNPEIKAAVSEAIIKRDGSIEMRQKQLGNAISCLGQAISEQLTSPEKNPALVKLLMDAGRLLCDCQHNDAVTRRNFVLYNVKKEMKDQLQNTEINKMLFGADIAETVRAAKAITKSGEELKATAKQTTTKKPYKQNKNLNYKAPPQFRRPKGPQKERTKEPAQHQRNEMKHTSSYKQSFHRPSRGRH